MTPIIYSETSVTNYLLTLGNIPEEPRAYWHCNRSPNSRIIRI